MSHKEAALRWYRKNKEQENKKSSARYHGKDHDRILKRCKQYNKDHREERSAYTKSWRDRNPKKISIIRKRYYFNHKDNEYVYTAARRHRLREATPPWADMKKIEAVYLKCRKLNKKGGIQYHVDHIMPLQGKNSCGLHVHWNLQIMYADKNLSKGNKVLEGIF